MYVRVTKQMNKHKYDSTPTKNHMVSSQLNKLYLKIHLLYTCSPSVSELSYSGPETKYWFSDYWYAAIIQMTGCKGFF